MSKNSENTWLMAFMYYETNNFYYFLIRIWRELYIEIRCAH